MPRPRRQRSRGWRSPAVRVLRHHGGFLYGNAAESLLSMGRWDEAEQMLNDGIALDVIGVESTHVRGVLGSLARGAAAPPRGLTCRWSRAPRWRGNTGRAVHGATGPNRSRARPRRGSSGGRCCGGDALPARERSRGRRSLLLVTVPVGARALADAAARGRDLHDDAAGRAHDTLAELDSHRVPASVSGTVAAAQQAQFLAETTRLDDTDGCPAWTRAAQAWEDDDAPYPLAYALLRSAEACAAAGNRAAATHSLRRAAEICDRSVRARCGGRSNSCPAGPASHCSRMRPAGSRRVRRRRTRPAGTHPARGRGAPPGRGRRKQQPDRRAALHHPQDGERPRLEHPRKLGVSGRGEAAAVAHRLRLFDRSASG